MLLARRTSEHSIQLHPSLSSPCARNSHPHPTKHPQATSTPPVPPTPSTPSIPLPSPSPNLPLNLPPPHKPLQNRHLPLQRLQPPPQRLLPLPTLHPNLRIKVFPIRRRAHGGAENRLDEEAVVRLERAAVGRAERGREFVGWVRGVVAEGLGGEIEAAGGGFSCGEGG